MRKLLWMLLFFGAYIWAMTSGHDRLLLQYGKYMIQSIISWFDDAEIDFQMEKKSAKTKKRIRRWE